MGSRGAVMAQGLRGETTACVLAHHASATASTRDAAYTVCPFRRGLSAPDRFVAGQHAQSVL